uniref:Cytochrome c biogenesis protein CcsA n=1 Tax=Boodleopsis sp. FL1161 TaxID=2364084 RepID=A0A386AZ60_9CHLO|nr:cytochrome c biogenesis protein ccs1 [Boodleopsis sp. FL1161]
MEKFLNNCSFLFLLCSMAFYWIRAFFNFSFLFYFGKLTIFGAHIGMLFILVLRGINERHFPLSNRVIKNYYHNIQNLVSFKAFKFYEALIFLSWSLTLIHLIIENFLSSFFIGTITAPTALFLNVFASFQLPLSFQNLNSLIPALQSNWLIMHVTVILLSYAALISGCLFSISFLFLNGQNIKNQPKNLLIKIDQLSFRTIGVGFALLTVGIISGSIWANEAWGSYWNWDPKETWSLITWLIFAVYLHLRINQNWKKQRSAILATFGFFVIWVCFLGVNFISKGLHSYGWFY